MYLNLYFSMAMALKYRANIINLYDQHSNKNVCHRQINVEFIFCEITRLK